MPITAVVDELVDASRRVTTTFAQVPTHPVRVNTPSALTGRALHEVARRYDRHGFAVLRISHTPLTAEIHLELSDRLTLGPAFVPPLYLRGDRQPDAVSTISAASNAATPDANHPSFGRAVGQELHCDGTLQPIGVVKATLMSCKMPAAEGGHNTLFASVAVFAQLVSDDLEAALALTMPDVLVRRANINGCDDANIGPAFAVRGGDLVGYYCITETDSWQVPGSPGGEALRRGIAYLEEAAKPGGRHFMTTRLEAGETIIFDNTRLSHGRTPYQDSHLNRRCLYRTLHLQHPCSGTSDDA